MTPKAVTIVGFNPPISAIGIGDREYWGFNHLWRVPGYEFDVDRFDRWFELHDREEFASSPGRLTVLRGFREIPIYMQRKWKDIPASRVFPKKQIEQLTPCGFYHMSSLDWMVAYAILEGFSDIHVHGVDFGFIEGSEPLSARACLEYWFGVAHGRGIDATCDSPSLFKWWQYERRDAQYGYTPGLQIIGDGPGD
jgi:hypothetical protein